MTEIEAKALALVNEVREERGYSDAQTYPADRKFPPFEALCRAIEQHEAFRQEVSDAVEKHLCTTASSIQIADVTRENLARFIIAKPDHVQDALEEVFAGDSLHIDCAKELRAALAARGLKIVEVGHD